MQGLWPFGQSWMDVVVTEFFSVCHAHRAELPPRKTVRQLSRL